MGRQGLGGTGAAGRSMQRSQSRSSLSASFEALAGYFPCMNSLEEDEGGEDPCSFMPPFLNGVSVVDHLGLMVGELASSENSK